MSRLSHEVVAAAVMLLMTVLAATPSVHAAVPQPNIVIVILDDMRLDQMGAMPETRRLFATGGVNFPRAYVSDPLCCPSRASIMTGRYVHNNGVKLNDAPSSAALDQSTTLQRYLHDGGYSTALIGKYLNGWPLTSPPPHFDRWSVMQSDDTYINPWFDVDGTRQQLTGHSTDLIGDMSIDVLQDFEQDDDDPFLMFITPYSPHGPTTPSPGDEALTFPTWPGNPAVFEEDRSDKPPVVRSKTTSFPEAQSLMTQMKRSVYGADRMIRRVFAELDRLGEANTTGQYTQWYNPTTGAPAYREYYDLTKDPWQLDNVLADGDPSNDPNVAALSAQLAKDRACRGTTGSTACP